MKVTTPPTAQNASASRLKNSINKSIAAMFPGCVVLDVVELPTSHANLRRTRALQRATKRLHALLDQLQREFEAADSSLYGSVIELDAAFGRLQDELTRRAEATTDLAAAADKRLQDAELQTGRRI